ncbi:tyrosine-type recombinase/integrase [Bradyrhizobium sp. LVM 105]|uniref:tyrosine-type recombinase/integrase n=1 Tax=Bradyrhizobium sp. LVM 105 TaxID=2341115 RepID=UPI000F7FFF39|nr:tyrosine-type recombinase/integrase [Bradyrhizobium sp. LVM 105]RTE92765.1 site-specific integrase [Bradyrhizobium sp. LVM 105]
MAGRKPKAPPGTQWRGNVLYSEFQVKGKPIRVTLKTDDPRVAKAAVEKLRKQVLAETYHGGGPRMFIDVLAEWKAFMIGKPGDRWDGQVGKKTYTRYCVSLLQIAPFVENKKLSEIDGQLIGRIVRVRGAEVTKATVKRDLSALSSVMNYAVAHEYRESNPVLPWLKTVKERRDPIVEPRDEDIALVVEHARGMWPQLVLAALKTGIREDALIRSQRDWINHERKEITVVDKGNKVRVVDLKPMGGYELFASLPAFAGKPWLFWRTEDKRVRKDSKREASTVGDKIEDPGPTFVRETRRVEAWAKANGIEFRRFTFHTLRHKHAIVWLRNGGNIYELQQRLGHSSIKQTEEYLKYVTGEQQRENTHGKRKTA